MADAGGESDEKTPVKKPRLRKYASLSSSKRARQEKEKARQMSRIAIGDQAIRWKTVKQQENVTSNAKFAQMLLDW